MKNIEATEQAYKNGYKKGYSDGNRMRKRREKAENNTGFLHIRAYNPYVHGVVGTDIKLTLCEKIKILFGKGISIFVGDVIKEKDAEDGK